MGTHDSFMTDKEVLPVWKEIQSDWENAQLFETETGTFRVLTVSMEKIDKMTLLVLVAQQGPDYWLAEWRGFGKRMLGMGGVSGWGKTPELAVARLFIAHGFRVVKKD